MSLKTAILENEEGTLVLIEPGAYLKDKPPAIVWNPHTRKFLLLDRYDAVYKWGSWSEIEPRNIDVPEAPHTL